VGSTEEGLDPPERYPMGVFRSLLHLEGRLVTLSKLPWGHAGQTAAGNAPRTGALGGSRTTGGSAPALGAAAQGEAPADTAVVDGFGAALGFLYLKRFKKNRSPAVPS